MIRAVYHVPRVVLRRSPHVKGMFGGGFAPQCVEHNVVQMQTFKRLQVGGCAPEKKNSLSAVVVLVPGSFFPGQRLS